MLDLVKGLIEKGFQQMNYEVNICQLFFFIKMIFF